MENSDKLALHAILIKKPCPLETAQEVAQEFIKDNKKKFYRETKNYYRFRNIPKSHFIPKYYKTKKINNKVSIIIGKLKPEFEHLEGSGMLDFFKKKANEVKQVVQKVVQKVGNVFKPRLDSYNNTTRKTLEEYGNLPIKSLTICRTPIMKILDTVINFLSLNKFSDLKKKYGFDELYHLQLVANIGNKNIVIEKNEVINVNTSFKNDSKTQTYQIPLNKEFTINEMLEKARNNVGDNLYFSYDAFKNNCQNFIKYCLEAEKLYSTQAGDFLFQDIEELAKEMPQYVKTTANVLTTTGAVANKLMGKAKLKGGIIDGKFELSDTGGIPWNGKWKFMHNKQYLQKRINELKNKYKGYYLTNYFLKDVDDGEGNMKYVTSARANAEAYDRANPQSLADGFKDAFNIVKMPLGLIPGVAPVLDVADGLINGGSKASGFFASLAKGKNKQKPTQFRKYNETGFMPNKAKKLSGNIIKKLADKDFHNFAVENGKADKGLYDMSVIFNNWIQTKEGKKFLKAHLKYETEDEKSEEESEEEKDDEYNKKVIEKTNMIKQHNENMKLKSKYEKDYNLGLSDVKYERYQQFKKDRANINKMKIPKKEKVQKIETLKNEYEKNE